MTHRPLTSLAISFPLLIIFRMRSTRLAVMTPSCFPFWKSISRLVCDASFMSHGSFWSCSPLPARVFVHCAVGVSRSASLVLAYLMIYQHYTLLEAIHKVKERRWIFPNTGFLKQLRALDVELRNNMRKWNIKTNPYSNLQICLRCLFCCKWRIQYLPVEGDTVLKILNGMESDVRLY